MRDGNDIVMHIKKLAIDAVNASKPTGIIYGKVTKVAPLEISVEQKITLSMAQLILTKNVTDYVTSITLNHSTEQTEHNHLYSDNEHEMTTMSNIHSHQIVGTKTVTIHNNLKLGEQVVMIQMQGGQKFVVLDKVVL